MSDAILQSLEPGPVWQHFLALKNIPRPSKHEQAAMEYLRGWANARGFATSSDAIGNLCVQVPASPGCENAAPVVIQNHVDIVVANADHAPDGVDAAQGQIPIERGNLDATRKFTPAMDGDWIRAPYTSLGADNGIGCAYALAVAEHPDLKHPPLELLFTVDEEEGMSGALQLDAAALQMRGRVLLNVDTEEDDVLTIGSAGGCDVHVRWEAPPAAAADASSWELVLTDLRGGHSGLEINSGRANAIRLVATALAEAATQFPLRIVSLDGGDRRNAIPRSSSAKVLVPPEHVATLHDTVAQSCARFNRQFDGRDNPVQIAIGEAAPVATAFSVADSQRLLGLLLTIPAGVFAMTPEIPDLPETSNNLALIATQDGEVRIGCSCRSSSEPGIRDALATIQAAAQLAGAELREGNSYPGWKPNLNSPILAVARSAYEALFQEPPQVLAVHAGLECGVLTNQLEGLDCISFGPTIGGNHAPGEHVSISSVAKCWQLVARLLADLT